MEKGERTKEISFYGLHASNILSTIFSHLLLPHFFFASIKPERLSEIVAREKEPKKVLNQRIGW